MAKIIKELKHNELISIVKDILRTLPGVYQDENDDFYIEIYADYRDEISDTEVAEIVTDDYPETVLQDKLFSWYDESEWQERQDLADNVERDLEEQGVELDDDELGEILSNLVYTKYPEDHYLNQELCVNIFVDTGDGNGDYVANDIYPSYCSYYTSGDEDKPVIPEEASVGWLIRQQGHKESEYIHFAESDNKDSGSKFINSLYEEVANIASHMNILTFAVKMTLYELIELNKFTKLQTAKFDTRENPDCGTIVLGKETNCGLYDLWGGGGSLLGIELEKDVELPIKFIRSALPDGEDGYAIESVYGMMGGFWKDSFKALRKPIEEMEVAA